MTMNPMLSKTRLGSSSGLAPRATIGSFAQTRLLPNRFLSEGRVTRAPDLIREAEGSLGLAELAPPRIGVWKFAFRMRLLSLALASTVSPLFCGVHLFGSEMPAP